MSAQIPLTGSVGPTGPFAILGFSLPIITGNADHVLTVAEYSSTSLKVTSDGASLAIRKLVAPLAPGMLFVVENLTSEGLAITVGGASGTAVTVPNGATVLVACPDGANYLAPGGGAGSSMIVANAAAMTALPASGLPNGTQAVVQTFGALFALSAAGPAVDGVTVIAASDARVWQRGPSLIAEAAAAQTAWYVDSQNSSGTASDENSGLASGTALRTKAEIARRMGGWSPTIAAQIVITYLSADAGGTDPGLFTPNFEGGSLTHFAAFPAAAFTGTLLAVTAKNIASKQALESTFTTTTGAVAADMILVNATRGSRAVAVRNTGGGLWLIAQPLLTYAGGPLAPTEDDTWAPGDAISGFVPLSIDIATIGGKAARVPSTFQPCHLVQQLTILDSTPGNGRLDVNCAAYPGMLDCIVKRTTVIAPGGGLVLQINGCTLNGLESPREIQVDGSSVLTMCVTAGVLRAGAFGTIVLTGYPQNPVVAAAAVLVDAQLSIAGTLGNSPRIYVDTGVTLQASGQIALGDATRSQIWGPGTLNVVGLVRYTGTAVASFPIGALKLNGGTNGYSLLTTAGLTAMHQLALTPAALDAAAGAAGFGGLAFSGSSCMTTGAQP